MRPAGLRTAGPRLLTMRVGILTAGGSFCPRHAAVFPQIGLAWLDPVRQRSSDPAIPVVA